MSFVPRAARLVPLLASVLALGACVPMNTRLQRATAGVIGCPAEEIAISNFARRGGATWNAECRGRSYICSGISGGESVQVACAEDASTAAAPTSGGEVAPPAPEGCLYDTQCKGDRICEEGRCVSPPPPPTPEPPPAEPAE